MSHDDMVIRGLCVMFALARESGPFVKSFPNRKRIENVPFRAWLCHCLRFSVVVAETGVGKERTEAALSLLLNDARLENDTYRHTAVVSAGFAGGLRDGINVGDVIAANEIIDTSGNLLPTVIMPPVPSSGVIVGCVLSGDQMIGTSVAKRELGERHHALAVDMESALIARRCEKAGVPFGCIRAISDDVNTDLSPRLLSVLADGRVSMSRALAALTKQPSLAVEFWRLARDTRRAARALSRILHTLFR